ncbi:MAG: hypothetical protein E7166_05070 [Firmicutes bacterium]|nr:hypothetical protein [Bacillota bacterium]
MNVIISNQARDMLVNLEIDVIKSLNGEYEADELVSMFSNFFFNKMILDITAIKNYQDVRNIQKLSMSLDMDKVILVLNNTPESNSSIYLSKLVSMGIYNFATNLDSIMYLYNNPNSYRDVAHIQQLDNLTSVVTDKIENYNMNVLGVKNITEHAGATTLIYMLKNQLELQGYNVVAVEVNKRDFSNFNSQNMVSCSASELASTLSKYSGYDIILVDLNETSEEGCSDVLYLLEPSYIKLNKLIRRDRMIFNKLKNKKIVLNKSLLDQKDITDFEYESRSKVFYNIPPLDDKKKEHSVLSGLLNMLGFNKNSTFVEENKGKVLGLFKSNN